MNAHQRRKMKRFVNRLIELRDIKITQYSINFWQRFKYLIKPSGNEPGMKVTGSSELTNDGIAFLFNVNRVEEEEIQA